MFIIRRDTASVLLILVLLLYTQVYWTTPIRLDPEDISSLSIGIECSAEEISMSDGTVITDSQEIREAVTRLNRLKVKRGWYSEEDLPGQSPSAWITAWDGPRQVCSINIYYGIMLMWEEGKYYGFPIEEHGTLETLCQQYGQSQRE